MEQGIRKERKKEMEKGFIWTWGLVGQRLLCLAWLNMSLCLTHGLWMPACALNLMAVMCRWGCVYWYVASLQFQSMSCVYVFVWVLGVVRVYVVWVCVSLLGALCLQWRVKWSISAFSVVSWSVSADGEGTLSQCCWTVACLTTQTKRWEQPLSHSHTDKHTHRANTTYISFCLISLHTISNLQRADCYSMFKGSCRQLSPCFLLPYRPMPCVTVTRIPYVKYVACLVGWCVFTPMLNAKSVIPQP